MAEFADLYRLLFELIELPLLVVVMLEVELNVLI